jgi:hypothetical protein
MSRQLYNSRGEKSLFDEQIAIEKPSEIANPLEKIHAVIDFEMFITPWEINYSILAKK